MDPGKKFEAGETLLFFDELQEFPEISKALKFFKIDGRFDIIYSGSLLGLHYKRIESNSVGYKVDYHMTSMDYCILGGMPAVAREARFKDYRGCIEWLKDVGMVNICYCLDFPELPLKGNYEETKYKLYFFDTGLFVAMLDEEAQEDLRTNKNLGVYKGALYENMVGEALVKSGYELYYF